MSNKKQNYRGIKPASIVEVCEGEGTEESPLEIVNYVVIMKDVGGFVRPVTIGKITPVEL